MTNSIVPEHLNQDIQLRFNHDERPNLSALELSHVDLQKFERLRTEEAQRQFLQSRLALRSALQTGTLCEVANKDRKPIHPAGQISISHCKSGSLSGFSPELELGVDIETERSQLLKLAPKFQRPDETFITEKCGNQMALQFIWGIKESLYKLHGAGSLDFKKHLQITALDPSQQSDWWTGTAWIWPNKHQQTPKQCYVQAIKWKGLYLCLASHRKPLSPLVGPRIALREWVPTDAPWLFELNADPEVIKFTGDSGFTSEKEALNLILSYPNYQRDGYGRWMVEDVKSGEPLGWCGLKNNPWGVDLGYRFFQRHWGNGYATEAAKLCIQAAPNWNLKTLVGRSAAHNTASINVLNKLGFITQKDFLTSFDNILEKQQRQTLISWNDEPMVVKTLSL